MIALQRRRAPPASRALIASTAAGLLLSVLLTSPAAASHDWGHTYAKTFVESGTWDYWRIYNYTDSDANNDRKSPWAADYLYAKYDIDQACYGCDPIRAQSAICGPAANSCERVVTASSTVVIDFDYYWLRSFHCGYDDVNGVRHHTPEDLQTVYVQCTAYGFLAHLHQLQFK